MSEPTSLAPDVRRSTTLAYGAVAVAFAGAVWAPILGNYFHADDYVHLQSIVHAPWLQWLLEANGGHLLPLRNAIFAATHAVAGTDPRPYFASVLVTHLVNVALLYWLLVRMTSSLRLACLGAAAWGTTPINEGTLGWYAVYGHVLATTFLLVVLLGIVRRLDDRTPVAAGTVLVWYGLVLLASFSFGIGIGLGLALAPAILLAFGPRRLTRPALAALVAGPLGVVGCYLGLAALYSRLFPGPGEVPFGNLLMVVFVRTVAGMTTQLEIVGATALVAGFTDALAGYPTRAAWGIAAAVGLVVAGGVALGSPRTRRLLGLVCLLVVGCYGIVAVGRAGVFAIQGHATYGAESARYHYTGTALNAAALGLALAALGARLRVGGQASAVLLTAGVAALLAGWMRSDWTIAHWDRERIETARILAEARAALDATPPGEPTFLHGGPFRPVPYPRSIFGGTIAIYTIWRPEDAARPVYAIDAPFLPPVGPPGSRLRRMFVPPACGGLALVACVPPSSLACELPASG